MAELDELLGATLKRVAEPGDPAGVADSIRARVDAGDTGTPGGRGEFGRGSSRLARWFGWFAVVLVVGAVLGTVMFPSIVASTMGTLFGASESRPGSAESVVTPSASPPGTPSSGASTPRPSPSASTSATQQPSPPAPEQAPPADPAPPAPPAAPPLPPAPPADTTAPSLTQPSASPGQFVNNQAVTVTVVASDDVAVSGVLISWTGAASGSASMSNVAGQQWQFVLTTSTQSPGPVTFTMIAVDAAGNQSAPAQAMTYRI